MLKTAFVLGAMTAGLLAGCAPEPQPITLTAVLTGASEVPPKYTPGVGTASADIGVAQHVLQWRIEYAGLTGPATAAHFHCPADPGVNAPVAIPLRNSLASPIAGIATINDAQMADLLTNHCYINIHTPTNPGGEIRGQLVRTN